MFSHVSISVKNGELRLSVDIAYSHFDFFELTHRDCKIRRDKTSGHIMSQAIRHNAFDS